MSTTTNEEDVFGSDEDIFHSVVMTEQRVWKQGFLDGIEDGREKHTQEGFNLGFEKGMEIGRQIGFFSGYASHVLKTYQGNDSKGRVIKVCETVIELARGCEKLGPMDEELTEKLLKLQAKFKQLSSLIGTPVEECQGVSDLKQGESF